MRWEDKAMEDIKMMGISENIQLVMRRKLDKKKK